MAAAGAAAGGGMQRLLDIMSTRAPTLAEVHQLALGGELRPPPPPPRSSARDILAYKGRERAARAAFLHAVVMHVALRIEELLATGRDIGPPHVDAALLPDEASVGARHPVWRGDAGGGAGGAVGGWDAARETARTLAEYPVLGPGRLASAYPPGTFDGLDPPLTSPAPNLELIDRLVAAKRTAEERRGGPVSRPRPAPTAAVPLTAASATAATGVVTWNAEAEWAALAALGGEDRNRAFAARYRGWALQRAREGYRFALDIRTAANAFPELRAWHGDVEAAAAAVMFSATADARTALRTRSLTVCRWDAYVYAVASREPLPMESAAEYVERVVAAAAAERGEVLALLAAATGRAFAS